MPRPTLVRAFAEAHDLEIRSDKRTICGLAVPFGVRTEISEMGETYAEEFARGAFRRTIEERGPARVKLLAQHNRQVMPVGRAHVLREDTAGLYAELRVSKTPEGDSVLELVNDGVLDSLSIGFEPIDADTRTRGLVVRTEVRLREVSVVPWPAYDTALISGVRAQQGTAIRDHARERLDALRFRYQEFLP